MNPKWTVPPMDLEEKLMTHKLCRFCGQPMKPKGVKKKPNEYDHAQGCQYSKAEREFRKAFTPNKYGKYA